MARRRNIWKRKTQCEECITLDATLLRNRIMAREPNLDIAWTGDDFINESQALMEIHTGGDRKCVVLRYIIEENTRRLYHPFEQAGVDLSGSFLHTHIIEIESTRQPLREERWWFICPLITDGQPCGRRQRVLYMPKGGELFGCRQCYDLVYRSSQEKGTRIESYRDEWRIPIMETLISHGYGKRLARKAGNKNFPQRFRRPGPAKR